MKVCRGAALRLLFVLLLTSTARGGEVTEGKVRESIEKSLVYVERAGVKWMETKGCVSCHHTSFLIWSHRAAARVGIAVDDEKLAEWTEWALTEQLEEHEKGGPIGARNIEGLAQLILAQRGTKPSEEERKIFSEFSKLVLSKQENEGGWKPGGQLPTQKRAVEETAEVSTMWASLALRELGGIAPESKEGSARAAALLAESELVAKSTEWYVMKLLTSIESENQEAAREDRVRLLNRQNKDGGWSWIEGDPSDALATGQALFGLAEAGMTLKEDSVNRALIFLTTTQRKDGAWQVMSTKKSKKKEALGTSVFWGTSWAAMGMARMLPQEERRE